MRIRPDGFTGALMAVEGIHDARALLHGPGGCRIYHTVMSRNTYSRMEKAGTADYNLPYFFGQPRIPCTYLDEGDFINGANDKVAEALPIVGSKGDKLIVVIDSPGAALIGDDHTAAIFESGMSDRAFSVEESLISLPLSTGYDRTILSVMGWLAPAKSGTRPGTVNLLGMSVLDKDWKNGLREVKKSIELMGLEVISVPGAGCTVDELKDSVNASLNVVVCPEFGINVAEFYKDRYGIPYVVSPSGAPVGFDSTEILIKTVAKASSKDPTQALERIEGYKEEVFRILMGARYKSMRLRGSSFSACGDASIVFPLTKWLYEYLSMMPIAVCTDEGSYKPAEEGLKEFLSSIGASDAFGKEPVQGSDFVFADGNTAKLMEFSGVSQNGIDIGLPSLEHNNVLPRPLLGAKGAMYLIDEIIRSKGI